MNRFDTSALWTLSDFRRVRDLGHVGGADPGRVTLLPTTLLADLRRIQHDGHGGDVLEVIAACVRNHEAALLYIGHGAFVWPVTLFPREALYHSPRDALAMAANFALSDLKLLVVEPPGVRAPGDNREERVAGADKYRPLDGLLWAVALHGPRSTLLDEIGGRVAYRLVSSSKRGLPATSGALASAVVRLERDAASLGEVAGWPGMSPERASRLLNALYLTGALMLSRSHPAANRTSSLWGGLFRRR